MMGYYHLVTGHITQCPTELTVRGYVSVAMGALLSPGYREGGR